MKSKGKMSNLRDHAPDNGKPAANTSQTTEPPWSISSTEVGAATNGVPTSDADGNTHYPPNLPTHIYRSQDFQPVGMTPPSINAFTNPLFTEQPPEANGLLSTSHLYAHQAPNNSFQQQQSRPPVLSMDTEELMNRAAYEVQQQLYQLQNINQSPQPSHWQDQYDQNHNASHLVSYDSPTLHNPYAAQAATQSLQNAFAQGQMTQQSSVMARHQSPTSLSQQEPIDDYRQHVHTINYHQHQSYSQFQQTLASQTEEVPSRKRLRSDSQDQSSSELHSLLAKEQNGKKPSKKRPRRESRGQLEGQSKQSEEEPSQKRSRGGSQSQRKSQSQEQEQPERVSLAVPPQLPQQTTSGPAPIPGETVVDADPATPSITVSATTFHNGAKTLLETNTLTKYKDCSEPHITYDIASTLMLSGIYLDSKSSVHESAAWLEWAFSMQGIWKRRPITSTPQAVPAHLLKKFNETYGNGSVVPVFDTHMRLVHGENGKKA